MPNLFTKLVGDKAEWKRMEARADALPRDYQIVYGELKPYLWRTAGGVDAVAVLAGILELFEASAAEGTDVLDVTGIDLAAFCDARSGGATSYLDTWRAELNGDVAKKLDK